MSAESDPSTVKWPWSELALEGPSEARAIKRAYAKRLKAIDRQNVEDFEGLRSAYDAALKAAVEPDEKTTSAKPARYRPTMAELGGGVSAPASKPPVQPASDDSLSAKSWADDEVKPGSFSEAKSNEGTSSRFGEERTQEEHSTSQTERLAYEPKDRARSDNRVLLSFDTPKTDRRKQSFDATAVPAEERAVDPVLQEDIAAALVSEDIERLRELLRQTANWPIRNMLELEDHVIQALNTKLGDDESKRIDPDIARVLEAHFNWTQNSVRAEQRFLTLTHGNAHVYQAFLEGHDIFRSGNSGGRFTASIAITLLFVFTPLLHGIRQGLASEDGFLLQMILSALAAYGLIVVVMVILQAIRKALTDKPKPKVLTSFGRGLLRLLPRGFCRWIDRDTPDAASIDILMATLLVSAWLAF